MMVLAGKHLPGMHKRQIYKRAGYVNAAEDAVHQKLVQAGKSLSRRGYPDFTIYDDDNHIVAMVEVKPAASHTLRASQQRFLGEMIRLGIRCFFWSPDGGFEELSATHPRIVEEVWRHNRAKAVARNVRKKYASSPKPIQVVEGE